METRSETTYEAPAITDHGSLSELTAASSPFGTYDRNFQAGQPNPPGNLDSSLP